MPSSLFYVHDFTEIPSLIGIDNDAAALESARQLVDTFGLSRIEIVGADAADLHYGDYDVINCSPFANPRLKVMERIASTAKRDAAIILREPFFTGTLCFESVLQLLDSMFEICAESEEFPGRFMLKHYILKLR